ncbi:MAG TPA: hypothetical protein VJ622_18925 [Acidimicrobiia bacterium]|nr:hypothetical protein [Acidimicrobiia bacterium]
MTPARRNRMLLSGLLVVATFGLSGCNKASDAEKQLRAALHNTEKLSNTFLYQETVHDTAGDHETDVRGLVEDDFRYKARVAEDGKPVLDEVVSDDAIAVRFLDPTRIGRFLRKPTKADRGGSGVGGNGTASGATPAPNPGGVTGTASGGPTAAELLATRRWVLDPAGAPAAFASAGTDQALGDDPIADARDVFAYVNQAIDAADRVVEFNPESLDYRKDEDPFPQPEPHSGVKRYDLVRPNLPKASQTGGSTNQVTPDARHFRKMSVYVKDKRVIQVRETIDVQSRLKDLADIYDTKFPTDRPKAEVAAIAVEALNAIRTGQGQDPIRMRDMELSLKDLGSAVKVDMPTDTTKGSLALLENRGRPADAANGVLEAAAVRAQPSPPPGG